MHYVDCHSARSLRDNFDGSEIVRLNLAAEMPRRAGEHEHVDARQRVINRRHHQTVAREDRAGERKGRHLRTQENEISPNVHHVLGGIRSYTLQTPIQ